MRPIHSLPAPLFALALAIGLAPGLALLPAACERKAVPGGGDGSVRRDALVQDAQVKDALPTDAAQPDGGTPCHTFGFAECRLQAGCAPDLCYTCSCIPTYEGCRRATDPPFECPQVGCPQPFCCATMLDCQNMGGDCAPPGTPFPCGMCNPEPGDCASDGQCAAGSICEPIPCSCDALLRCVPDCTTTESCPPGTTCSGGAHGRCLPTNCSTTLPCPPDFDCTNGLCARRPCVNDLHCDHFCVNGFCFEGQGECRLPAP
ncbi:MAG: hypothetical protein RBU30_18580 [Polyangia bacterium]|jgi:hypothetical protein|nr:hypothetical protein [Polyangia bacterium]